MIRVALFALVVVSALSAAEESLEKFEIVPGVEVSLAVPEKWSLSRSAGGGYPSVALQSADGAVSLQVSLFPDARGLMADPEMRAVMMTDVVARFLPDSLEQEVRLQQLNPRLGSGIYCVFTDAKLVAVKELPPNEFRHATAGLRSADGWFAVFTIFSQDTASADYRTALDLVRHQFDHAGPPRQPARSSDPRVME